MFNTNAPQGIQPVRKLDGSAYTGATNEYKIASAYATAIGKYDPVTLLSDGTIGIGVAGAICVGIFMGCKYQDTSGVYQFRPNWVASTVAKTGTVVEALVLDDPNMVFTVQETAADGTIGTPLALADRNLNINFVIGAPNAVGLSTTSINNASENTTVGLNFKIFALDPHVGNAVGGFANWLVTWNAHLFRGGAGTTGV